MWVQLCTSVVSQCLAVAYPTTAMCEFLGSNPTLVEGMHTVNAVLG